MVVRFYVSTNIVNKKRNVTCKLNASFLCAKVELCNFSFMADADMYSMYLNSIPQQKFKDLSVQCITKGLSKY